VSAPEKFQWERLPRRLIKSIADSLGLPADTATAELARRYGTPPDWAFVRENWDVLRDEWLPDADDVRRALVAELMKFGVGYAGEYPAGRRAEMAFLRTCNNAGRLREAVLAELIPLGESSHGKTAIKSPAELHWVVKRVQLDRKPVVDDEGRSEHGKRQQEHVDQVFLPCDALHHDVDRGWRCGGRLPGWFLVEHGYSALGRRQDQGAETASEILTKASRASGSCPGPARSPAAV
jgi:hypothetical protein